MAARGASAAGPDAGHRVPERAVAGGISAPHRRLPPGARRRRFCRGPERRDRVPMGTRSIRPSASAGRRPSEPPRERADDGRRRAGGSRSQTRHFDDPDRVRVGQRPGQGRAGRKLEPARRQRITFMTTLMETKRIGLLRDLVPGVPLVGVLLNPSFPPAERQLRDIEEAARSVDQRIVIAKAGTDAELDAAFASLIKASGGGLLVGADPYFDTRRERIVAFAQQQRLPAIYQFREFAVAGGLLSYGIDVVDAYRQYGVYTARILKGARPADLPVLQPTKFELVINLKTARALGVKISDNLLSLADEVIE